MGIESNLLFNACINIFALLFKINLLSVIEFICWIIIDGFFLDIFFVIFFIFPKINNYPPGQYQICADIYSLNKDTINEQNRKHVT